MPSHKAALAQFLGRASGGAAARPPTTNQFKDVLRLFKRGLAPSTKDGYVLADGSRLGPEKVHRHLWCLSEGDRRIKASALVQADCMNILRDDRQNRLHSVSVAGLPCVKQSQASWGKPALRGTALWRRHWQQQMCSEGLQRSLWTHPPGHTCNQGLMNNCSTTCGIHWKLSP